MPKKYIPIAIQRAVIALSQGHCEYSVVPCHHIKVTNYLMVLRSRYAGRPAFLGELGKVGLHFR